MKAVRGIVAVVAVALAAGVVYHFQQHRQVAQLNNEATALLGENRFAEARAKLEQARTKAPRNHVVWKNLGVAYEGLNENNKAIEAYERSLAIAPGQTDIRDQVAVLKKEAEMERQKIESLETQIRENPDNVQMLTKLGYTYEHLGDFKRAVEFYERSLKVDANQPDVRRRLEALRNRAAGP